MPPSGYFFHSISMQHTVTLAYDILYARYQLTDLDQAEVFMSDFGLVTVQRDASMLRMRAVHAAPFVYEAAHGPTNRFIGIGFAVESVAALERLAALPGSSPLRPLDGAASGHLVRMTMPDGFEIDAVWDVEPPHAFGVRPPFAFNAGQRKQRANASVRQRPEPAPALRLGHVVLHVSDHAASVAWLRERLGLLPSDHFGPPTGDARDATGTFLRVDRGSELVDHHCLLVLQSDSVGVHHVSFEMQDLDHVMAAHDHLSERGWQLDCGVGRHLLGSQIYDYWRDPAGFRVEHYTDGDIVNHAHQPSIFSGAADETTQWGMAPSKEFFS
jgi:catechol 2,3-dioxygenase-like lactoylglutathione lyase family enzyme